MDLISLNPSWGRWFKESWLRTPLYHDASRTLMFVNPGLKGVRLAQEYDLFVAICQNFWDLPYINAIHRWKDYCKTSVCWLDEIWASTIPGYSHWLHALSQFDHIFVGCRGSVAPLSAALNRTCHWLPGAVDTLRFSPFPTSPARVIDVYSVGRRNASVHRELLKAANRGDMFYVYDTFAGNDTEVFDHNQHRELYANVAKRSRYFMVAPGRMGDHVSQGQVEVGYRFYEGTAAGAVLVGEPPICDAFSELFPWPDAVMAIRADGSDIIHRLSDLNSDLERIATAGRRNAVEALLRHDWVYRWNKVLRVAGVEPSLRMTARQQHLKGLAELAAYVTGADSHVEMTKHLTPTSSTVGK